MLVDSPAPAPFDQIGGRAVVGPGKPDRIIDDGVFVFNLLFLICAHYPAFTYFSFLLAGQEVLYLYLLLQKILHALNDILLLFGQFFGSNIAPQPPAGYDRTAWRAAHGIYPNDMLIGFFGFLNRSKGVETLIEALGHLIIGGLPAHLLFIGGRTGSSDSTNARYADEIDALIEEQGLSTHVQRTGFTTPTEVSAALLAVDMCALPYRGGASLRHGTLHAALAHGNAIVTTTPQITMPQLRDGKNVVLIQPENATALADALRLLWMDSHMRANIGQQAAQLSREFSWERIAARTAEFFRALVRESTGSTDAPAS